MHGIIINRIRVGDAPVMFGSSVPGLTVKGMTMNVAIGTTVNTGVQLAGNDPFSYVDAIMAGVTAILTNGKGVSASAVINVGGALVGSSIQGKYKNNEALGAAAGYVAGSSVSNGVGILEPVVKESTKNILEAVGGSMSSEYFGNQVKDKLKKAENEGK